MAWTITVGSCQGAGLSTLLSVGSELAVDDRLSRAIRNGGQRGSVYGYKAHVGVDDVSGLIRAVVATWGNVNDTVPADALSAATRKLCGRMRSMTRRPTERFFSKLKQFAT
jgi:IS5 family transposase